MIELVSEKVWESLRTVTWPGPVRAAIAYVGREAPDLLPLGTGDTLVFDGSDESLAGGTTTPAALQVLFDRGVILVSVARLHAKVIVAGVEEAGERKTLVGSANASEHSRTSLREAALLTDDVEVASRSTSGREIPRPSGSTSSGSTGQRRSTGRVAARSLLERSAVPANRTSGCGSRRGRLMRSRCLPRSRARSGTIRHASPSSTSGPTDLSMRTMTSNLRTSSWSLRSRTTRMSRMETVGPGRCPG